METDSVGDLEEMIGVEVEMGDLGKCFPQYVTIAATTAKYHLDQVVKNQCIAVTVSTKRAIEVVSARVETTIAHNAVFGIKAHVLIDRETTDLVLMQPVTTVANNARFLSNQHKINRFFVMNVSKTIKMLVEDKRVMHSRLALKT